MHSNPTLKINFDTPLAHRLYVFRAEIPLDYAFENRDIILLQRVHVLNLGAYPQAFRHEMNTICAPKACESF